MQYRIDLRIKVLRLSFSIGPDQVQPDPKNNSIGLTKGSTSPSQNSCAELVTKTVVIRYSYLFELKYKDIKFLLNRLTKYSYSIIYLYLTK